MYRNDSYATEGVEWHTDPGHGWLRVNTETWPDALDSGTGFGFAIGTDIYLEEDCEAGDFLRKHPHLAVYSMSGRLDVVEHHRDAPCRSYPRNTDRQEA